MNIFGCIDLKLRSTRAQVSLLGTLLAIGSICAFSAPNDKQTSRAGAGVPSSQSTDLSGMWWILDYSPKLEPMDGAAISFTTAGKALYDRNLAQLRAGTLIDAGRTRCLPEGLPRTLFAPYPMQIVQHGSWITFIHEVNHIFWSVSTAAEHPAPDDLDPMFMGDSTLRWQGHAAVIDSVGFKNGFLDDSAMAHSDKLHVVTRLRLLGPNTLEVTATISDEDTFAAPFSARHLYERRPDVEMQEYICGEEHRVLTGTRAAGVQLNGRPQ